MRQECFVAETKRERMNHEAPLINCFSEVIKSDTRFGIKKAINIGSDGASYSDVEYLSNSDEYLIIEAKSHESKDAYNTRHKIFGQLLKEHGKNSPSRQEHEAVLALGVLIPKDATSSGKSNSKKSGYDFYRDGYSDIPEKIFSGFGELAKVKYVFLCSIKDRNVDIYTWTGFHRGEKPIYFVPSSA
jgi:hypothetical protein